MSDLTLFENQKPLSSELAKSLEDVNANLLSGASTETRRRISLNGGKFRQFINGEQVNVSKEDNLNVIIVNAAPISRTYYSGVYDPSNPAPPKCWSHNTTTPAPEVSEGKQASRCMDCPQNIKGSGQGESRACRFAQRLAVVLEGDLDKVYQLQLPATSIFGDGKDGNMPMQSYAKFLNAHSTAALSIVTNIRFDENSSTPKLFFKAVRPLEEDELKKVLEIKDNPDTVKAITLTVAQTDGVKETQEVTKEERPKQKPLFESEEETAIEEPKKVAKKKAAPPKVKEDLSSIIDDWDD